MLTSEFHSDVRHVHGDGDGIFGCLRLFLVFCAVIFCFYEPLPNRFYTLNNVTLETWISCSTSFFSVQDIIWINVAIRIKFIIIIIIIIIIKRKQLFLIPVLNLVRANIS